MQVEQVLGRDLGAIDYGGPRAGLDPDMRRKAVPL